MLLSLPVFRLVAGARWPCHHPHVQIVNSVAQFIERCLSPLSVREAQLLGAAIGLAIFFVLMVWGGGIDIFVSALRQRR